MTKPASGCPCGCASCPGTCCSLECLEQPSFFCGQLLTDQDLTALIVWAKGRLGLSRFRHGWGVVCGLAVGCDPKQCGVLTIGPGYAVGCCGDDILVCQEDRIDVSAWCDERKDPCADRLPPQDGGDVDRTLTIGGSRVLESELRVVDLFLRYVETPSAPQSAFGRGVCKQVQECEFGRRKESYAVDVKPVIGDAVPGAARVTEFADGYNACLEVLAWFNERFASSAWDQERRPPVASIKDALLSWIDDHPLTSFCGLRVRICDLKPLDPPLEPLTEQQRKNMTPEQQEERKRLEAEYPDRIARQLAALRAELAEILFWMVQDYRNAYLACACFSCPADSGVPLARVWLRRSRDAKGEVHCCVLAVDTRPPYRRPIGPECWPALRGRVNLGQVIWHEREDALGLLARHGVTPAWDRIELPASPDAFPDWYLRTIDPTDEAFFPFLVPSSRLTGHLYVDPMTGRPRVVGFSPVASPPILTGPALPGDIVVVPDRPRPVRRVNRPADPGDPTPVAEPPQPVEGGPTG